MILPFYKYFLKYVDKKNCIEKLYKRCLNDVSLKDLNQKEIREKCELAMEDLIDICLSNFGTFVKNYGVLNSIDGPYFKKIVLKHKDTIKDMLNTEWEDWMKYPVNIDENPELFCETAFLNMTLCGFEKIEENRKIRIMVEEIYKNILKKI